MPIGGLGRPTWRGRRSRPRRAGPTSPTSASSLIGAFLPASPETVAAFLASEVDRGIRPSTIARRVAAIRYANELAGHRVPTDDERVKATERGHRRAVGAAPPKKAPADRRTHHRHGHDPGVRPKHLRDRALLLRGFAGAFRRSELVGLDVEDLEETDAGLRITIRKSKTTRRASPSFGVDRPWSTLSDPRNL